MGGRQCIRIRETGLSLLCRFFLQAEDGIRDRNVTGVQTCALPILKTHFFSHPAYQGPFLVRAKRLDRPGPIRLGAGPSQTAPLVVPRGQTPNGTNGWREIRSEEHTSELQSRFDLVCRLVLEKKKAD